MTTLIHPQSPRERAQVRRDLARGTVERILPGVYGPPGARKDIGLRIEALHLVDPGAILTGAAAARMTWWPEITVRDVTATRPGSRGAPPGYRWEARHLDPELLMSRGTLLLTGAPMTVLDLLGPLGGAAIDEALRRGAVDLPALWSALERTSGRPGNTMRRRLLLDSRDTPWSEAERHLHRLYRDTGLPYGYATNHRVDLDDGQIRYLDLALPDLLLDIEADGWTYHGTRAAFESDRERDAALQSAGWQVIRFSVASLEREPERVMQQLVRIVRHRAASQPFFVDRGCGSNF